MKGLLFLKDIFRKFRVLLVATVLTLGLVGLIEVTSVFTLIPVVDFLLKADSANTSFLTKKIVAIMQFVSIPVSIGNLILIFLAFNFLGLVFQVCGKYLIQKFKYAVVQELCTSTFKDIFQSSWRFFSTYKQGVILNTFIQEMNIVGQAFGSMANFFAEFLILTLYCILPFYLSWKVACISLSTALLLVLPFFLLSRYNYKIGKLSTETVNEISSVTQESLASAKVILGFGKQNKIVSKFRQAFSDHCIVAIKKMTLITVIPIVYYYLGLLVLIITMIAAEKFKVPLSEIVDRR